MVVKRNPLYAMGIFFARNSKKMLETGKKNAENCSHVTTGHGKWSQLQTSCQASKMLSPGHRGLCRKWIVSSSIEVCCNFTR